MSISTHYVLTQAVTSRDGTSIHYLTIGKGAPLIVIPGAMSTARDFVPLAEALADNFTVHIIERRGRGLSSAMTPDYCISKDCEDIAAVQAKTGAQYSFGHSYGGLIAFEAARCNTALKKIAVYEPGVSIDQSIPIDWIPAYQALLNKGDQRGAFVEFVRGSGPDFMKRMPDWWLRFIMRIVVRGEEWDTMASLLPTNVLEHQEVARLDDTYRNYAEITADTLLMAGGKSPAFREQTLQTLAGVLSKSVVKIFPKLDHFGPTRGVPSDVAATIKAYFLA